MSFRDIAASQALHPKSVKFEPSSPSLIVRRRGSLLVNRPVEFEHQSQLRTIEVNDKSIDRVLSTELESEYLAVSQNTPRGPFRRGGTPAECASSLNETELDRVATDPHGTTVSTAA